MKQLGGLHGVKLRAGARYDHLSLGENHRRCLWLPDAHDCRWKSQRVVLRIPARSCDLSQIEPGLEVCGGDDILDFGCLNVF